MHASSSRRAAAIAAAAQLGPMHDDVAEAIRQQREKFADKRKQREPVNRRKDERRVGPFDRRESESRDRRQDERRQFATMEDKLAAEAKKQEKRRFSGDSLTDFGDSL